MFNLVDPGRCIIREWQKNHCLFISVAPNGDKGAINFLPPHVFLSKLKVSNKARTFNCDLLHHYCNKNESSSSLMQCNTRLFSILEPELGSHYVWSSAENNKIP